MIYSYSRLLQFLLKRLSLYHNIISINNLQPIFSCIKKMYRQYMYKFFDVTSSQQGPSNLVLTLFFFYYDGITVV